MSPTSAIEKDQFTNPKKHQVGAVIIDSANKAKGVVVPPGGTIWLSEDEQRLTANAPKRDEDNPFVKGQLVRTGANRPIGNERPLPGDDSPSEPQVQTAPTPEQRAANEAKVAAQPTPPTEPASPPPPAPPVEEQAPVPPEPVPVPPVVDHTKHLEELERERSQGSGDPIQPEGLEEETAQEGAQATPGGPEAEELGAAVPPVGEPPEGQYQAQEEVGTPGAPAAQPPADQPPAPAEGDGPLKMQD